MVRQEHVGQVQFRGEDVNDALDVPGLDKAVALYEEFNWFAPSELLDIQMQWPARQGIYGHALITSYLSDKFDGQWREYKHAHGYKEGAVGPYPVMLREKMPFDELWRRNFKPNKGKAYAVFGFALDIQAMRPDMQSWEDGFVDFKWRGMDRLPILAGDVDRNLLLIVDQETGEATLLWSPIMKVTYRGILY